MNRSDADIMLDLLERRGVRRITPTYHSILLIPPTRRQKRDMVAAAINEARHIHYTRPLVNSTIIPKSKRRRR